MAVRSRRRYQKLPALNILFGRVFVGYIISTMERRLFRGIHYSEAIRYRPYIIYKRNRKKIPLIGIRAGTVSALGPVSKQPEERLPSVGAAATANPKPRLYTGGQIPSS